MEIERAQMRLRIFIPSKEAKRVHEKLKANISIVESEDWPGGDLEMVLISKRVQIFLLQKLLSFSQLYYCLNYYSTKEFFV